MKGGCVFFEDMNNYLKIKQKKKFPWKRIILIFVGVIANCKKNYIKNR